MAIVRKDKMLAGYNGNLESVIVYNNAGSTAVETTNGVFVVVEGLIAGKGREVKKARLANEADKALDVLLVHNSEIMYDERQSKLEDFKISAGKVARAYRLYDGDIITLTSDLFDGVVAVGDELLVKLNGKLGKSATLNAEDTAKVKFLVIENAGNELHETMGAFAVQVIRN